MEKKELKEEIKKVLEGKSIYEMSPISGLNPMTKEEIIYWIVETYIDQELDKAREEGKKEAFTKDEWFMLKLAMNDIFNNGNTAYEEISEKIESYLNY